MATILESATFQELRVPCLTPQSLVNSIWGSEALAETPSPKLARTILQTGTVFSQRGLDRALIITLESSRIC